MHLNYSVTIFSPINCSKINVKMLFVKVDRDLKFNFKLKGIK